MIAASRAGDCVCGVAVAFHFDRSNRRVSCVDAFRRARLVGEHVAPIDPRGGSAGPRRLTLVHRDRDRASVPPDAFRAERLNGPRGEFREEPLPREHVSEDPAVQPEHGARRFDVVHRALQLVVVGSAGGR